MQLVLMALFCASVRRDSVSLLKFPFRSHVNIFSCEIPYVYRLRYSYSYSFSYVSFQYSIVLFIFMLSMLFLIAVIHPFLLYLMLSSPCIDDSTKSSMLASLLVPFFQDIYILCHLSDIRSCASLSTFLSFYSICLIFCLVHFKNGLEYLTSRKAEILIPLMRFLLKNLVSRSFLVRLRYSFLAFSFISICLIISGSNIPKYL